MVVKNSIILLCVTFLSFSFFGGINSFAAAEFISGDTVSANKVYENVYVTGSNVTVDAKVQKDLIGAGSTISTAGIVDRNAVVIGGTVTIKSQVGASLFVAGGTVVIDSPYVVGSARVAGNNVTISGNFNEDVMVAGSDVVFKNANVVGDVYVGAGTLTVINSTIKGKIQGQYGEIKGDDLRPQVAGVMDLKKVEKENNEDTSKQAIWYFNLSWQASVLLVTLLVAWLLARRNRLSIPSIKWSKVFGMDILIGLGAYIIPGIAAVIFLVLQLYPLALLILTVSFLIIVTSQLVLPIYVGNFIKNTWHLNVATSWAVTLGYIVLLVLGLITNIQNLGILGIVAFIFVLAHTGFMLRTSWLALNHYLVKR